jgi:hypothetical protein
MGDAGELYQRLAEATLLTLINAFLVSTVALIPDINVDWLNVILGVLGTLASLFLARQFLRLHQHSSARLEPSRDRLRVISLSVIVTTFFVVQVVVGLQLMMDPTGEGPTRSLALVIVGLYVLGIARAWILLGDPQHGWSGWLNPLRDPSGRRQWGAEVDMPIN